MATALSNENVTKIGAEESESLLTKLSASSIVLSEELNFVDHAKNAFKVMESYFNDLWLTDVTLVTSSKRIDVHRLVLSASSPYFAAMFKSLFKESIQDEIEMKEINGDALLALVQYCYTGSLKLQEDNVEILFATARLLQIDPVVEACSQFLIKQLDPCNCLGIKTFAEAQGCDSLSSAAHAYALEYFVQVVQNEEFLLLSADKVAELLQSEDVNVPSEETIFNALTTWLKHDAINRIKDAPKLLSYVKLPLLTPEFIGDNIQENELFDDQKAIQDLILETFTYHLLRRPTDSLLKSGRTRPRKSTVDILLALGEIDEKENDKDSLLSLPIDAFDLSKNTWKNITNMKNKGRTFGAVCFEEKLFVVGGIRNRTTATTTNDVPLFEYRVTNTVEVFDFSNQLWNTWPSMQTCRSGVGVGILNGFLYAVGGIIGWKQPLNTVERCDLVSKEWSFVAPMSTERCNPGVAVLNNKLYVIGSSYFKRIIQTVECYDPVTNKWTFCSPMPKALKVVGTGVLNGYIYVIADHTGMDDRKFLERYDPTTDKWTLIAPISAGRLYPHLGVLDNRLFVLSKHNDDRPETLVEAYDPDLNQWQEFAPLEKGRVGPCVVVDRKFYKL